MKSSHRIVIIGHLPTIHSDCHALLESQPALTIVRTVNCASGSFSAISEEQPDLVILALALPACRTLQLVKDLTVLHPALRILIVANHDDELRIDHVVRAGAQGCLTPTDCSTNLLPAVREILNGGLCFGPPFITAQTAITPAPPWHPSLKRKRPRRSSVTTGCGSRVRV